MPKNVNTALKAKANAEAWTFEAKAKATGPEAKAKAKAIKFGLDRGASRPRPGLEDYITA